MKRRQFIAGLVGAAAWPVAAEAQQQPMPVIGFLYSESPEGSVESMGGFRQGLKDAGYVEGENVTIDYRWAENQPDRLPGLVAELVRRPGSVIAAMDSTSALPAKSANTTVPIVPPA
jgi:ABC-type uncharacterized transport system substrate-binding protein